MKTFENPEITINEFEVEDVVTVSSAPSTGGENELPFVPFAAQDAADLL